MSKRTLYQHFAGKDELVAAYLAALAADPAYPPNAVLARADLAPRARLLELYATLADDRRPLRGCPFVNAGDGAHRSLPSGAAGDRRTYKREFADRLSGLAREAGARGSERLGRRLTLLYDGAAAQVRSRPDDTGAPPPRPQALAAALLRRRHGLNQ